jgi:hypothetical protein
MFPSLKPFRRKPKHHNIIELQTAWTLAVAITQIRACTAYIHTDRLSE